MIVAFTIRITLRIPESEKGRVGQVIQNIFTHIKEFAMRLTMVESVSIGRIND